MKILKFDFLYGYDEELCIIVDESAHIIHYNFRIVDIDNFNYTQLMLDIERSNRL